MSPNLRIRLRGFTLVELAIVLLVLGLLAGAILLPIAARTEQRFYDETRLNMEDIRNALLGYAAVHKHLPCPDSTGNDGIEDFSAGTGLCSAAQGNLPWATLGLGAEDAWRQPFLYRVTPAFAQRAPATSFSLSSTGNLRVCQTAACAAPLLSSDAAAIVVSRGKNLGNCSAACPDEAENYDNDNDFVSRTMGQPGSTGGEYDDLVIWISPNLLFSRMIGAGQLP